MFDTRVSFIYTILDRTMNSGLAFTFYSINEQVSDESRKNRVVR